MKIKIKTREDTYFLKLMLILSNIPPFDRLRPKELILYSHLLNLNHKYRNIPFKERNKLIFNYDTKLELADKMKVKQIGINNMISVLRTTGLIEERALIPKYTLNKVKELTFVFEDEEDSN